MRVNRLLLLGIIFSFFLIFQVRAVLITDDIPSGWSTDTEDYNIYDDMGSSNTALWDYTGDIGWDGDLTKIIGHNDWNDYIKADDNWGAPDTTTVYSLSYNTDFHHQFRLNPDTDFASDSILQVYKILGSDTRIYYAGGWDSDQVVSSAGTQVIYYLYHNTSGDSHGVTTSGTSTIYRGSSPNSNTLYFMGRAYQTGDYVEIDWVVNFAGSEPPPGEEPDSCTYVSGDWEVDASDECAIDTEVAMDLGSTLTCTGTGWMSFNAELSGCDKIEVKTGCSIYFMEGYQTECT